MLQTLQDQVHSMAIGAVQALPSLGIAIIILLLTWLVSQFAGKIAKRMTGKAELRPSLDNLVQTIVGLAVWLIGTLIAAIAVFPDFSAAGLIAGLGVGTVAIGFAFQDIFENFLAGILIMLRNSMHIGDTIQCEGILGSIEHISLRETHIRHFSGELSILPNSMLFKNPVEIWNNSPKRRYEVVIGVSYDTDLDKAADAIENAVKGVDLVITDEGVQVLASEFNSSSVDFIVRWWSASSGAETVLNRDQVIRAIKKALDDHEIEIPFPYVTHTFKERIPMGEDLGTAA